mgnify:CR=1 FL=1|jgi:hypothetical protein
MKKRQLSVLKYLVTISGRECEFRSRIGGEIPGPVAGIQKPKNKFFGESRFHISVKVMMPDTASL